MGAILAGFLTYVGKLVLLIAVAVVGFIAGKKLKDKKTAK